VTWNCGPVQSFVDIAIGNRPRKTDQQDPVEQRFSSSHGLGRGAMGRGRSLVKEDP